MSYHSDMPDMCLFWNGPYEVDQALCHRFTLHLLCGVFSWNKRNKGFVYIPFFFSYILCVLHVRHFMFYLFAKKSGIYYILDWQLVMFSFPLLASCCIWVYGFSVNYTLKNQYFNYYSILWLGFLFFTTTAVHVVILPNIKMIPAPHSDLHWLGKNKLVSGLHSISLDTLTWGIVIINTEF